MGSTRYSSSGSWHRADRRRDRSQILVYHSRAPRSGSGQLSLETWKLSEVARWSGASDHPLQVSPDLGRACDSAVDLIVQVEPPDVADEVLDQQVELVDELIDLEVDLQEDGVIPLLYFSSFKDVYCGRLDLASGTSS